MINSKRKYSELDESIMTNISSIDIDQKQEEQIEEILLTGSKKKIQSQQAIKTFCRIRPIETKNDIFKIKEEDDRYLQINVNPNILKKFNGVSSFTFSKTFSELSTQIEVFENTCQQILEDLINKKKPGLVFTYGMTNAGKTFTVIGSPSNPGILPMSLNYLYDRIQNNNNLKYYKIFCNFVEIYNEEVFDLLSSDGKKNDKLKKKLLVKEKDKRFFLPDVSYSKIENIDDFNNALNKGISKKTHASTNLNQNSSRSHTIFKIILKSDETDEETSLSIVDLAGSERANRTETQGKELQEACKINQSLSVLGKCMEALRYNSIFTNKRIVPFRESKLTMLFQEYFQGDQNIIMITNINPRVEDFEETMRALNYSCIAKEIKPVKSKIIVNPLKYILIIIK
jgi:kinesin family protein 20